MRVPTRRHPDEPTEDLAGEVAVATPRAASGPVRFAWLFLPWLAAVVALAAWLVRQSLLAYFALATPVAFYGTARALGRIRRDLRDRRPEAPDDAVLVLGGPGLRRNLGLAWIDGDSLRFVWARGERLFARADVARLRWRPVRRELELALRPGCEPARFRLGALISLTELPRFARAAHAWLASGR